MRIEVAPGRNGTQTIPTRNRTEVGVLETRVELENLGLSEKWRVEWKSFKTKVACWSRGLSVGV